MAEISYPFNADNANGGSAVVSQTQWQAMAHLWGGDRVDFQLTSRSYSSSVLPFGQSTNGRVITVKPGKAWVGGFYYTLTESKDLTIPDNASALPRKDLIVIQADMAKSSVNLAVVTGTPAASPKAPNVRKQTGGLWELPLYVVDAGANQASLALTGVAPFDTPMRASYPWNAAPGSELLPQGSFYYDMDSNSTDAQWEGFVGRDGNFVSRDLGRTRTYTPSLVNIGQPAIRRGRWRYVAPGVVWFSLYVASKSNSDLKVSTSIVGVTLPVPASGDTGQIFSGYLDNSSSVHSPSLPNFVDIRARIFPNQVSAKHVALYIPNVAYNPNEGLDGLSIFPRRGELTISGIYEADTFGPTAYRPPLPN